MEGAVPMSNLHGTIGFASILGPRCLIIVAVISVSNPRAFTRTGLKIMKESRRIVPYVVRLVHFGLTWLKNLLNNVLLELLSYSNYSCSRDLSFSLFQLSSRSADCHCNLFHVLVILYLFFTMESIGNFWTIVLSLELLYPTIKLPFLTLSRCFRAIYLVLILLPNRLCYSSLFVV